MFATTAHGRRCVGAHGCVGDGCVAGLLHACMVWDGTDKQQDTADQRDSRCLQLFRYRGWSASSDPKVISARFLRTTTTHQWPQWIRVRNKFWQTLLRRRQQVNRELKPILGTIGLVVGRSHRGPAVGDQKVFKWKLIKARMEDKKFSIFISTY